MAASGGTAEPGDKDQTITKRWYRAVAACVAALAVVGVGLVGAAPAHASVLPPHLVASIPVGFEPLSVLVNPRTNLVYAESGNVGKVAVIDPATNVVTTTLDLGGVSLGFGAVNLRTNEIYITNPSLNLTDVIDGATNTLLTTIPAPTGAQPDLVAVDRKTNRVYIMNVTGGDSVSVVDGATNQVVATIPVGRQPTSIAVNPRTNRIFVVNNQDDTVSVLDGNTNQVIATVPVGHWPANVEVNPATNRAYVVSYGNYTVSVIDGATNTVTATIPLWGSNTSGAPDVLIVNARTDKVYVTGVNEKVWVINGALNRLVGVIGNFGVAIALNPSLDHVYISGNNVAVIDGATNSIIRDIPVLGGGSERGIAVNPRLGRVYAVNPSDNAVSVIADR